MPGRADSFAERIRQQSTTVTGRPPSVKSSTSSAPVGWIGIRDDDHRRLPHAVVDRIADHGLILQRLRRERAGERIVRDDADAAPRERLREDECPAIPRCTCENGL